MIAVLRRTVAPLAVAAGLVAGLATVSASGIGPLGPAMDAVTGALPTPAVSAALAPPAGESAAPATRTSPLSRPDVPSDSATSVVSRPAAAHPAARPASSDRAASHSAPATSRESSSAGSDTSTDSAPTAVGVAFGVLLGPADGCISCSSSVAGADGSSARAVPIQILGAGVGGGDTTTDGNRSGAIVAVPANPLLAAALGSWVTEAETNGSSSSAHSRVALGDLAVGSGLASATVLEASSDAQHDGARSAAHSANNGLRITAAGGAVDIILLHTDTSSDGTGRLYIASVNGTRLGESQGRGGIPIVVPGVARVLLLSVGAFGGPGGSAAIGTVDGVLGDPHVTGLLYAYSAGGAAPGSAPLPPGTLPVAPGPVARTSPSIGSVSAAAVTSPATHPGAAVPSTGTALSLLGAVLIAAGLALAVTAIRGQRCARPAA